MVQPADLKGKLSWNKFSAYLKRILILYWTLVIICWCTMCKVFVIGIEGNTRNYKVTDPSIYMEWFVRCNAILPKYLVCVVLQNLKKWENCWEIVLTDSILGKVKLWSSPQSDHFWTSGRKKSEYFRYEKRVNVQKWKWTEHFGGGGCGKHSPLSDMRGSSVYFPSDPALLSTFGA